jgi:hypothetical protein
MSGRSLSLSWAIHHFDDEMLKDLCIINGLDFKKIKEQQKELETPNLPEFILRD